MKYLSTPKDYFDFRKSLYKQEGTEPPSSLLENNYENEYLSLFLHYIDLDVYPSPVPLENYNEPNPLYY